METFLAYLLTNKARWVVGRVIVFLGRKVMRMQVSKRRVRHGWMVGAVLIAVALVVGSAIWSELRSFDLQKQRPFEAQMACSQWHGANPLVAPMCQTVWPAASGGVQSLAQRIRQAF